MSTEVPTPSSTLVAPAATPPAATNTPPPPAAAASTDWTSGLSDDVKSYVTAKGFKAPQDVVDSYRNYEKLMGDQKRLVKVPDDMTTPEGRQVFERLGMPKEAKDYALKVSDANKEAAEAFKGIFHENNLTQRQAEGIFQKLSELREQDSKAKSDQEQLTMTNARQTLEKDWGQAFEQNMNLVDQGALSLGMGEKEVKALGQALGPDGAMKLLLKFATATGESSFVGGRPAGGGVLTPDLARNKIDELKSDDGFRARLLKGDVDAKRQWDQAHQAAYPGITSL